MNLLDEYLKKLSQAISIKSISTDPVYDAEIHKMAKWCEKELAEIGFKVNVYTEYKNPIVYGELIIDPSYKTVLHYGHYDVQPATKDQGWHSSPFELTESNGKYLARGVVDNKGQFLIYLTVIKALYANKNLKYNVKFLLEGEEEIGSTSMAQFVQDHLSLLKSDVALISDGEILGENPCISVSFRGSFNALLTVYGPKNDLHSGGYGGVVINPINALAGFLSKLSTADGTTDLAKELSLEPSQKDITNLTNSPFSENEFVEITGISPTSKSGLDVLKTIGFDNSIQITGISGGYEGEGFRNAIPSKASAKINVRVNPSADSSVVVEKLKAFVQQSLQGINYELVINDPANGVKMDLDNDYVKDAEEILRQVYGKDVIYQYVGGTIPIAYDLSKRLNMPALFIGLANEDCNMHGPDENFKKDLVIKALLFAEKFLAKSTSTV